MEAVYRCRALANPAFLYASDTGEKYPPMTSNSVLNFAKSAPSSNIRRWRKVIGEKEPHAIKTKGVLVALCCVSRSLFRGKV